MLNIVKRQTKLLFHLDLTILDCEEEFRCLGFWHFKVHSDPFRIWFLSGKCGPLTQALASGGPFGLPAPGHRDHKPAACMALKVALQSWNDLVNGHFRY